MRRYGSLRLMALLATGAAAFGGGCASAVDVRYPDSSAHPALLSSVAPRRVVIAPVVDRRLERARIGAEPKSQDAIVARRPVEEIVRRALAVEIAKNGHSVVTDTADIVLAVDVEEFWIDAASRQGTTQYVGRVALALRVVDAHTGDRRLTRRYVGIKRRLAEADAVDVWREIMDAALARTLRDIATDPELVAALAPR
jgi:hypothetical protein